MKKNIINILSTGVVLVSSILFSSCGPDFLDTTPSNRVSTNEAFTSANKANAIMNLSVVRPEHGTSLPKLWIWM